jgi:uncharacterized membrane protein YfcA
VSVLHATVWSIDLLHMVIYLAVGAFAGIFSAAFGVGGAALSTPLIEWAGVPASFAVASTIPSILPGAIAGTYRYRRENLIRPVAIAWVAPSGIAASIGGSLLSDHIPGHGHWLMVATSVVLLMMAISLGRGARRVRKASGAGTAAAAPASAPVAVAAGAVAAGAAGRAAGAPAPAAPAEPAPGADARPNRSGPTGVVAAKLVGFGALSGALAGLLGLGGGVVLVPTFVNGLGFQLREAIATSLVCVGLLAVPSMITHAMVGDISWPVALLLTVGTVPGARLGAVLALRAREARLRLAVAACLVVIAAGYGTIELVSLLS